MSFFRTEPIDENHDLKEQREKESPRYVREPSPGAHTRLTNSESQNNFLSGENQLSLEDNTKQEGGNWNGISGKTPNCPSEDLFMDTSPGDTEDSAPCPANSEQRDTERPEYSRRPTSLEYSQGNNTTIIHNGPLTVNVKRVVNFEIANQSFQSSISTSDMDSASHDESFQSIDVQSAQQTATEVSHETSQKMPIATTTEMSPLEEQSFDRLTNRSESFELGDTSSVREAIANRPASSPSGTNPYSWQTGTHTQLMLLKSFDEANISERTFPATESPSESNLPFSSIAVLRGADTSFCVAASSQSCAVSKPGLAAVDTNSMHLHGSPSAHSSALQQVPVTEILDLESFTESRSTTPVPVQEDDRRSSPVIHLIQPGCEDMNAHLLNAQVEAEEPRLERVRPSNGLRRYAADKDNLEPETFQSKCESNSEWSCSSVLSLVSRGHENTLPEAEQNKQCKELSENYLSTGLENATVSVEAASPVKNLETSVETSKNKGPIKNTKKYKRRKKSRK